MNLPTLNGQDFIKELPKLELSTVYADKLHDNWLDIEGASRSYSGDFLRKVGVRSEQDFISLAGGYLGHPSVGRVSIRGLNSDNILGYLGTGSNSIITSLVNGVPVSDATSRYFPQQLWALDSVNVLYGGQSNSYGPNSLGGVILYQSRVPTFDNSGSLYAEFSEFNTLRSGFEQNFRIKDQAALRFSYQRVASDGSVENTSLNLDDWARIDRHIYEGQGIWISDDNQTEFYATIKYDESDSNPFGSARTFNGFTDSDRRIDANTRTIYPANHWLGTLKASHRTTRDISFTNQFGFSSFDLDSLIDLDGSALLPWFINNRINEDHFSNDFNIKGSTHKHIWSAGYYLQHSSYKIGFDGSGLIGSGVPFSGSANEDVVVQALYAKDDYSISSNFNIISGIRINYEERDLSSSAVTAFTPPISSREASSYLDFLPSLSLVWKRDENTQLGFKASRNYRGGGVSYAPTLGLTQSYDPEYSNDLELYYKSIPNDSLQFSSSIYFNELNDMQIPISVTGGIPDIDVLIDNSGEAMKFGAEVQILWEPMDNMNVNFSVSYVHTEFTELFINGEDLSGESFPNAPELTSNLNIGYLPEVGFFWASNISWTSSSYTQISSIENTELSSRLNLDTKIGYKGKSWDVYVFGKNLFNRDYALGRVDGSGLGAGVFSKVNEPRTFGLGFSKSW